MSEVIKCFFESILSSLIVGYMIIISIILIALMVIFYPFKKIKLFLAEKIERIADTADYFLDEDKKDEQD